MTRNMTLNGKPMLDNLPLTNYELTHYTNMWCRSVGIKSRDLTKHPQIDDVIILVKFHQEFWFDLDSQQRGVWAALWSWVYHKQFSLKAKHLNKLANITASVIGRRTKAEKTRQHIKALRESIIQQRGVHMTANPLLTTECVIPF
jgi:hypothetical protein